MWDWLMSFMDNWYFIGGCIFLLVVLGGFLAYRLFFNKQDDDD
jgi:hypothetical protein